MNASTYLCRLLGALLFACLLAERSPVSAQTFRRGDANVDGGVNISDGIRILNGLFSGEKLPCEDAADSNDSGKLDISDGVVLFNYLFSGGVAPPAPGTENCGVDPTTDSLGCASYSGCATEGDRDGDGLLDTTEVAGWTVLIDELGLGAEHLTRREVTSDPNSPDTDGDGLDDGEEFDLRTDPRTKDTDGDRLDDYAEVSRWQTKPVSVDSDEDARGPSGDSQPNSLLFDGNELLRLGTSPSLSDTDGDGKWDFDEIDDPIRSPLIAELPEITAAFVGEVDVRLNVEYEEQDGVTSEYGNAFTQIDTSSQGRTDTQSDRWTVGSSVTVGAEYEAGLFGGASASVEVSVWGEYGQEHSTSFTTESSHTSQNEYSEYQTDSRTLTERAASGSISLGLRVDNTGSFTYDLSNLALTILQWRPEPGSQNRSGTFRTVATLTPPMAVTTLAPGESSKTIQVQASDVNASLVKEFLANPTSLHYETSNFDFLSEDGLNFDFITENAFKQTALLVIDFGDGNVESYRVATNVERDANGDYMGISMKRIMEQLAIPYQVAAHPKQAGEFVLAGVRGYETVAGDQGHLPRRAWTVFTTTEEQAAPGVSFEDMVVHFGDSIRLVYTMDADQDGLFAREERLYGTSDDDPDSDEDGLSDFLEIRERWEVGPVVIREEETVRTIDSYLLWSDPTVADADEDGLTDSQERVIRTDPRLADTDADGIDDAQEIIDGTSPIDGTDPGIVIKPPPTDMLVFLTFNESLEDVSGNNNHAVLPQLAGGSIDLTARDRFGDLGYACDFEDNDFVDLRTGMLELGFKDENGNPTYDIGDRFTMATWVYRDSHIRDDAVLMSQHGRVRLIGDPSFSRGGAGVVIGHPYDPILRLEDPSGVDAKTWQFFVVTVEAREAETTVRLYRNGELVTEGKLSTRKFLELPGDEVWTLGASYRTNYKGDILKGSPEYPYDGVLDDVRLYNRVLSLGEIRGLYNEPEPER